MKTKHLSLLVFALFVFILSGNFVQAKTCSLIKAAPYLAEAYTVPYVRVDKETLTTAADSCYGSNTEVWFSSIKTMPDSWTHDTGYIHIDLYEEDPEGNDDERVKYYVGFVEGKVITSIQLIATNTPGLIDSTGDQQCELYLRFSTSGTTGRYINKSLFNYKICMN